MYPIPTEPGRVAIVDVLFRENSSRVTGFDREPDRWTKWEPESKFSVPEMKGPVQVQGPG